MSEAYVKSVLEDPNLTKEQKEALLKGVVKPKTLDVNVTVDSQIVKDLAKENAELKQELGKDLNPDEEIEKLKVELSDRESKLQILAEKEFARIQKEHPEIKTIEDLEKWKNRIPSGSAPLEGQYRPLQGSEVGFESYPEMIDNLRERTRSGDRDAELILRKLTQKTLRGVKEGKIQLKYPQDPEIESEDNKAVIEKVIGQGSHDSGQESEIAKFTKRKRKKVE